MKTLKSIKLKALAAITLLSLSYISCDKDRIEEEEPEALNEYSDVNDYFDQKKQDEQEFVITNEDGPDPIEGKEGTKIWISKSCLKFPNGDTVGFPYTVKLIELLPPKEMIYYQMPSVAGGDIMETDGEVRVRAFKDGIELELDSNCFSIEIPHANPENYMLKNYGFDAATSSSKIFVDWTDDLSTFGITTSLTSNFTNTTYGYWGRIPLLGWINCGIVRNSGAGHLLTFISTTDDLTNIAVYVYFQDLWGLMQVYDMQSGLIPNGSKVKVICIGVAASGTLFSYQQDITVTANTNITVTLSSITDVNLTALLDAI